MPFRSNAPQANINPTFDRSDKNDSEKPRKSILI
jgi:hypothetical protein